jgi:3-methyl-2-oxobutanoate hydroxymethyltransferase
MGHIGLTPQSVNQLGGWRVQGKTPEAASQLLKDAIALDEAGAFAVVLEQVPTSLATLISKKISIPTIGIGAGNGCDGQVLVINDVFGLSDRVPKLAKQYTNVGESMRRAVTEYYNDVKSGAFPTDKNSFTMDESILAGMK